MFSTMAVGASSPKMMLKMETLSVIMIPLVRVLMEMVTKKWKMKKGIKKSS
jgi:hypothetical protein